MKGTPVMQTNASPFRTIVSPLSLTPLDSRAEAPNPPLPPLPSLSLPVSARSADASSFSDVPRRPRAAVRNSASLPALPECRESCDQQLPHFDAHRLCPGALFEMSCLPTLTAIQLRFLLYKAETLPPEPRHFVQSLVDYCHNAERYYARLSARFEAMCVRWDHRFVWFTRVDDTTFVFALAECDDDDDIVISNALDPVRVVSLPECGVHWSELQQHLVDHFEDDDHVRAILAASVLSYGFDSVGCNDFNCVHNELVPSKMRCFDACIAYDVPVDYDILTLLADPRQMPDGELYFDCANGHFARVVWRAENVSHLEHMDAPPHEFTRPLVDECRMPYLYGGGHSYQYGTFLNCEDPTKTATASEAYRRVHSKQLKNLLSMVRQMNSKLDQRGLLDLSSIATTLADMHGTFLPGAFPGSGTPLRTRRVRGSMILIQSDGLYIMPPPSRPKAVEGGVQANCMVIKANLRVRHTLDGDYRRVEKLSEVAEYLLGEKYEGQLPVGEHMVYGPDDLWGSDAAVTNTIVALMCRKYGLFEGFAKAAAWSWNVRANNLELRRVMNANIFLPMLHVFADPALQVGVDPLYTKLAALFYGLYRLLLTPYQRTTGGNNLLLRAIYWDVAPLTVKVGDVTVYMHNNPFLPTRQKAVEVFAVL